MADMLDVDNVCVLACHLIYIYFCMCHMDT